VGPLYGPIKLKYRTVCVHELCALWTPEIYLNDENKFQGLTAGIERCWQVRCSKCGEWGGGLGCKEKRCPNTYHYGCAFQIGSIFDRDNYVIFCPEHVMSAS